MKFKIFLLSLFILPFIIISFFNQPSNDDFWSADIINHYGRLSEVKYFAENINGRFLSNLIMGLLNPLPQGETWLFKAGPIIIIILFVCSFFFFYKSVFYQAKNVVILFLSLLFVVSHILNMRSLFEGLYWTFAALSYQVSIMLLAITAGAIIRYYRTSKVYYLVSACVCSFILPGSVETIVPLYLLLLCAIFFILIKQKCAVKAILLCVIANLAGIAIVLASSGNYSRITYNGIEYKSDIFLAAFYAIRSAGYYCCVWLVNPANLLMLLLLIPYLHLSLGKFRAKIPSFIKKLNPFLFLIIATCFCLTVYLPEHYFESAIPYPRITTIFLSAFLHVILISLILFFIKTNSNKYIAAFIVFTKKYQLYIAVLFFISIFCSKNFLKVSKDLISGTASHYNIEAEQRFQLLKNCPLDTCYVSRHKYWAASLENFPDEDLNANPFVHINTFFGKTILYKDSMQIQK